jgi:hypothetical protein
VTVVGVTGHRDLPAAARPEIERRLRELLTGCARELVGVSPLARGADQLFAEVVLALGGRLHVVVPCRDYPGDEGYAELRARATVVEMLDHAAPSVDAYLATGKRVVELADEMVAVWDGRPARGLGGTADIVAYARAVEKPLHVVWPEGAERL